MKKILNTDPEKRFKITDIRSHPWFLKYQPVGMIIGLIVGNNTIPTDDEVLKLIEQKNLSKEYAIRCLDANKHNHVTTCYYLLLKKLEREGKIEVSKYYQSTTTMHPISLHGSRENSLAPEPR